MEKLKPILTGIKRHHFWILSGIGVIAILYCWNAAVGQIEEQFNKNKKDVSKHFADLNQLNQRQRFPNEQWAVKTKEVTGKVNDNAQHAWQRVVQLQKPSLLWPEALGEDFPKYVDQQEWPLEMIQAYAEVAPEEIQRLKTVMGAAENANSAGVVWGEDNFNLLAEGFAAVNIKTTADCKIRQNALWLYQSLAEAIATTNDKFEDRFNLPIHTVVELAVDFKANLTDGEWTIAGFSEAGPPPAAAPAAAGAPQAPAEAAAPAPTPGKSLLANISVSPVVEGYELRPFRLRIRMSLDYLPKLLSACANSKIPLDVYGLRFDEQVRLTEIRPVEIPRVRPDRRIFRGITRPAPVVEQQAPEPEGPVKIERGTLVEIWGYGYFTRENEKTPAKTAMQGSPTVIGQAVTGQAVTGKAVTGNDSSGQSS